MRLCIGTSVTERSAVKPTKELVDIINMKCSLIKSFFFDHDQWCFTDQNTLEFPMDLFDRLESLPIINYTSLNSYPLELYCDQLAKLHLRGNIEMLDFNRKGDNPNRLLELFSRMPNLVQLVLERDDENNKYRAPILTMEHMESIHAALPNLVDLQFINHFNLGLAPFSRLEYLENCDLKPHPKLRSLKLEGALQCYQWAEYLSLVYPALTDLQLNLIHSPSAQMNVTMQLCNFKIKEAFTAIAYNCKQLQSLSVHGLSTPIWLTPQFMTLLEQNAHTVKIDAQLYGLDSRGTLSTIELLLSMQAKKVIKLTGLRLPVWKRADTNWRSIIQPLAFFTDLVHLDLDMVSMSLDQLSSCDGFELDRLLSHLPGVKSLKLSCSSLALSPTSHDAVTSKHPNLTALTLSKMSFTTQSMEYLSKQCRNLKRLVLYDCQQLPEAATQKENVKINLTHLDLDLLVLSRVKRSYNLVKSRAPGARLLCFNQSRWYHLCKEMDGDDPVMFVRSMGESEVRRITDYDIPLDDCVEWNPNRAQYHSIRDWMDDLVFGYISLECNSVKQILLDEWSIPL
ncbi:hypothetical protein K501DRAFT_197547 [Backusella circina FSU 941]|nr:hypothetical protein K501DRAFT_197547 [Backusella circina FSU 941]